MRPWARLCGAPSDGASAVGQDVLDEIPEVARLAALSDAHQRAIGGVAAEFLQESVTSVHPRTFTTSHRNTPQEDLEAAAVYLAIHRPGKSCPQPVDPATI